MSKKELVTNIAKRARNSYRKLGLRPVESKNKALELAGRLLIDRQKEILEINKSDVALAIKNGKNEAFIDRLKLTTATIISMQKALQDIAKFPDPVGKIIYEDTRPNGLQIRRVTVPLGVIGIIYESRPNVTVDAWGLCLKSGNGAILRPGSESFATSKKLMDIIREALEETNLEVNSIQMLPGPDREYVDEMLKLDDLIDVIIPRGGRSLIEAISKDSRIPIFKHLDGNCHTYIHEGADLEKAVTILFNAKMRRTGICGATESVVIDRNIAEKAVPLIIEKFSGTGCEILGDEDACKISSEIKKATEEDFSQEYLDKKFSIKIVNDLSQAITHINKYSSHHTDAIITENEAAKTNFLNKIDSAIVMHNTSTQFADGGEFGLGAEIGISTGRMHARGPVGLDQLVTYKYQILGQGQIRP